MIWKPVNTTHLRGADSAYYNRCGRNVRQPSAHAHPAAGTVSGGSQQRVNKQTTWALGREF